MDDFLRKTCCERCGNVFRNGVRTLSKMNLDCICLDCKEEETKHPRYKEACKAEEEAVKQGNYNYKGLFYGERYPFK